MYKVLRAIKEHNTAKLYKSDYLQGMLKIKKNVLDKLV